MSPDFFFLRSLEKQQTALDPAITVDLLSFDIHVVDHLFLPNLYRDLTCPIPMIFLIFFILSPAQFSRYSLPLETIFCIPPDPTISRKFKTNFTSTAVLLSVLPPLQYFGATVDPGTLHKYTIF